MHNIFLFKPNLIITLCCRRTGIKVKIYRHMFVVQLLLIDISKADVISLYLIQTYSKKPFFWAI